MYNTIREFSYKQQKVNYAIECERCKIKRKRIINIFIRNDTYESIKEFVCNGCLTDEEKQYINLTKKLNNKL